MSEENKHMSQSLSEVLNDIGVNDRMVMKRRRTQLLCESVENITFRVLCDINSGCDVTIYHFGSLTEGSTTLGLKSDKDALVCDQSFNIIQDWSEWEYGKFNFIIIQDENTTPGYCFLQLLQFDQPLPMNVVPDDHYMCDTKGRVLCKNTIVKDMLVQGSVQHGPAIAKQGHGFRDKDIVIALPCKSFPRSASYWLMRHGIGRWPTQEMKRFAVSAGCFVVPTGSKVSRYPELEWRISTSLAERHLMFDLNITQIRCYVLIKMILKSFFNAKNINISSFMCKTVLFHCIENTEPSVWKENNLFTCLTYCLLELHRCIQNDHCSHFIIQENNLMAGQFTAEIKHELSKSISDLMQSGGQKLFKIEFDDLGHRLQVKMNLVPQRAFILKSSLEMYKNLLATHYINLAYEISVNQKYTLKSIPGQCISTWKQLVQKLITISENGDMMERDSCNFLSPLLFTTYGTALASYCIGQNNQVSPEALIWLSRGLSSDLSSSRLKLATVLFSTGDMEKAKTILRQTEHQYLTRKNNTVSICTCSEQLLETASYDFMRVCNEQNEECIKHITTFCVRFIQLEINCVPHELQYEMFRSTKDDIFHRGPFDYWMDWAVVDPLPFLYFMQYKTFNNLQKQTEKQQALRNLTVTIEREKYLWHKETALNLLGQCKEQEERLQEALECYIKSLQVRVRNNAASVHICKLLSRLLS